MGTSNVARDITERKRAEARVIASESSLALAQSLAHLGSWDFDLVRRTGTWSREMYRLFHLDPAQGESAFVPFVRLVHPDDRAAIERIETDIALNTAPRRVDYRTNPALGPMRYISALLHVEHDAAGNAVRTTGVAMDVTEAREAELASQSERRFSDTMIESALGILYFYSESGRFLRWNRNFERVTGYGADDIARMSPLDFFPAADRDDAAARIADVFASGSATLEASLQARDGSCVPYLFTGRRVELDGVPCLVGMGIDMSESKRMLHLLQASQASLARAQRIAHLGSWEVDIATSRLLWSDEVHRIAGTAPGEQRLRPENFLDIVHPDDIAQVRAALRAALAGTAPLDLEHRIVRPDGALRWVHQVGELQRDDEGRPSVLAGTVLDITGRKTADQQLRAAYDSLEHKVSERTAELLEARVRAEAADRLKSAFLATMSHELRTPLNSIIGFTSIVLQGMAGPLNAEQSRQLGMVRTSARHLLELINDVLDLSRIEAGQLDLQQQPFDVRASIDHAVAVAEPLAAAKSLSLSVTVAPEVGEVLGDRRRVEQILINLLGNAVKFTEKGHIALVAQLEPGDGGQPPSVLRLTVADTGIGIKPDDIPTLFQPFQQIDIGLARRHEGTGLGLAICRRLAHLMGGRIFVESRWGQGSRFSVDVPLRGASTPP